MAIEERVSRGWPAPAKINLFLHVVGRRPDGYHLLQTLFQFLDFGDEIDFEVRGDGAIVRVTDLPGVPPSNDLVIRAARLLQQSTGTSRGADIAVTKRIPLGGGMGGGSSDAATVLVALNELWNTGLTIAQLTEIGIPLGADVPVFVHGHAAWAEGVGEILTPVDADEGPVLIVVPDCQVDTRTVFSAPDLVRDTSPLSPADYSFASMHNDCEPVTRRLYPEVGAALEWLSKYATARMSGTGASVYAFFDDRESAQAVADRVPPPWRAFCASRRNRSRLRDFVATSGG